MREMKASERAAFVAVLLARGERLTTAEVARRTECSLRTAQRTMVTVERVVSARQVDGYWQLVRILDVNN